MASVSQTVSKIVSKSETGHARNAANFEQLTAYAASLGAVYNPSKESLTLSSMQVKLSAVNDSLSAVNEAFTIYSNAIAARETAFKPLKKLITRVSNSFRISSVTDEVKQNAESIIKKLQGQRISARLTEEEKKALAEKGEEKNQISASQMSFDSRIENLDKFVKLLASTPQYAPNEDDLKTTALAALYADLKAKNTAAITSDITLKNARIVRNEIMYKDKTGMVDIAMEVKNYLKSVDGATGPKYKAISKLNFINHKNK